MMKEPDPGLLQQWLDGYLLALGVVEEVLKDLRGKGVPLTWEIVEWVVTEVEKKGRTSLIPTDSSTLVH